MWIEADSPFININININIKENIYKGDDNL